MSRSNTHDEAEVTDVLAGMIRHSSTSGRLISASELCRQLIEQQHASLPAQDADIGPALEKTLQRHDDIRELLAHNDGPYYYSSQGMTEAYAVMLLQKLGDPARLIAEVIREASASYPRPVPLSIFTHPPFELTAEQVADCLQRISADEEYRDIASTTTSASTLFLYSTLHLEPDHASMLAEWFDVGQLENP